MHISITNSFSKVVTAPPPSTFAVRSHLLKLQCPRRASSTRTRKSSSSTSHMRKNSSRATAVPMEKEMSRALEMDRNSSGTHRAR